MSSALHGLGPRPIPPAQRQGLPPAQRPALSRLLPPPKASPPRAPPGLTKHSLAGLLPRTLVPCASVPRLTPACDTAPFRLVGRLSFQLESVRILVPAAGRPSQPGRGWLSTSFRNRRCRTRASCEAGTAGGAGGGAGARRCRSRQGRGRGGAARARREPQRRHQSTKNRFDGSVIDQKSFCVLVHQRFWVLLAPSICTDATRLALAPRSLRCPHS